MTQFIASLLVVLTSQFLTMTSPCSQGSGATEDLASVVMGRCVDYARMHSDIVCAPSQKVNCTQATNDFLTAFAGLPTCNVSMSRYDVFLTSSHHPVPANKSLFWEGVYDVVHRYSDKGTRMMTLEDTLTGYMMDRLHFCSSPGEQGGIGNPSTAFCPSYEETEQCPNSAEATAWSAASQNYASKARGVITIMLNGSTGNAFPEPSYFGTWELPNIRSSEVTHANIWLVHVPGDDIRETCSSAGIKRLENMLSAEGIASNCTENPLDVLWLLCWDHKDHPECRALLTSGATTTSVSGFNRFFVLIMSSVFMLKLFCIERV